MQTRLLFSGNLIKHPCFDELRGTQAYRVVGNLNNTDLIMNNTFWIGVYPGMTREKLQYMIDTIRQFVAENHKETLAQVFTDVRYTRENNELFSKIYLDFIVKQGFKMPE